jgi:glycosyltransferase involved in cell wall biosynthesis
MKLLLVTNNFPNRWQPTKGIFNLSLARALARRDEVRVIAPILWGEELSARLRGHDAHVLRNDTEGLEVAYPRFWYPPGVLHGKHDSFYWHSIRSTVRRVLARFQPDAVLSYWVHPDGAVANRIARLAGVPSGIIVGGSDVLVVPRRPRRRAGIVQTMEGADAILTVSQHLCNRVVSLGIDPGKVQVWRQGVDRDSFFPGDRVEARRRLGLPISGNLLLWVGRLVPVKGLDVLVRAARELRDRSVGYHLYLVGGGPLRAALEADVMQSGLAGQITFLGSKPPDQLPDWYRAADVTVLPSRSEGLPNVLRESLACGTRFVASDVGGVAEIARPDEDRLVPPDDPAALAEALVVAIEDGSNAVSHSFAPTSWEESAEHLVRIFLPLVEQSKARRETRGEAMRASGGPVEGPRAWRRLCPFLR